MEGYIEVTSICKEKATISGSRMSRRERLVSDTALLCPVQMQQINRLPLKDLTTNICTSNVNDTILCTTVATKKRITTSGDISSVADKKLKSLKNVIRGVSPQKQKTLSKKKSHQQFEVDHWSALSQKATCFSSQGIPKDFRIPSQKLSLLNRLQSKHRKSRNTAIYELDPYSNDYLENILHHELRKELHYVVDILVLNKSNQELRTAVVHALIKAADYFEQPISVLCNTVFLFDYFRAHVDIPLNMFQLVSCVIMWIVIKIDNNINFPSVKKLAALCNNVYTVSDILAMEKKILNFFEFFVNLSEITLYINAYTTKLSETSDLLFYCVHYILECYTLSLNFPTVRPSMQAAGAVCLAMDILQPPSALWHSLTNTIGYYTREQLKDVMQDMLEQIHKIQDPGYEFRFPFQKYAAKEKQQASIVLLRKLLAS